MDARAMLVGSVLTAAAVLTVWFGKLPWGGYLAMVAGPFVAGFLSRSRESKAFEGVASMGAGFLLALLGLIVGHFLLFDALPMRWRIDAAFTTFVFGLVVALFFIPMCCVAGAVCGGAGGLLRDVVREVRVV